MAVYAGAPHAWPPYAGPSAFSTDPPDPGLEPGLVTATSSVTGPTNYYDPEAPVLRPGLVRAVSSVIGPIAPLDPSLRVPLRPGLVTARSFVRGPRTMTITPPVVTPGESDGYPVALRVEGYDVTGGSVSPIMNGKSTGTFSTRTPVAAGTEVTMTINGEVVLEGVVITSEASKVSSDEYQVTYDHTVESHLREWEKVVVFPDFGSGYGEDNSPQTRLGTPAQDTRYFDWTMNGGYTSSPMFSIGRDPMEAALAKPPLPMPDNWGDQFAEWMWPTKPGLSGRGWAAFVESSRKAPGGDVLFELCCYDTGELWVDGVQVLKTSQAGKAVKLVLDLTEGHHRIGIRCHNGGGNAGVLFSMNPIDKNRIDPENDNLLRSASGWRCSNTETNPAPFSLIQTFQRLMAEAQARGCLGGWNISFVSGYYGEPRDEAMVCDVGMTYMDVLNRFGESWFDYYAAGRTLIVVRKDQSLGGAGNLWTQGVDLLSSGTEVSVW